MHMKRNSCCVARKRVLMATNSEGLQQTPFPASVPHVPHNVRPSQPRTKGVPWHNRPLPDKVKFQIIEYARRRDEQETLSSVVEERAIDDNGVPSKWVYQMVDFWSRHGVRQADISVLVNLGEQKACLRDPDETGIGMKRLKTLLPDCNVPDMLLRDSNCLGMDMVHAAYRVLELQDFMEGHHSREVELTFERHPNLLLVDSIYKQVSRTVNHILHLKPVFTEEAVLQIVRENSSLLQRVHIYQEFHELPYDIQNLLYHPRDGVQARIDEYAMEWDEMSEQDHHDPLEWILDGYDTSSDL
mmetsp:Transcript_14361/g.27588  ORF Transcript_14361/g.27588 Transcript_14361/m.27588 type:complete len:300 (+) Transcript_14361:178-1077(+)